MTFCLVAVWISHCSWNFPSNANKSNMSSRSGPWESGKGLPHSSTIPLTIWGLTWYQTAQIVTFDLDVLRENLVQKPMSLCLTQYTCGCSDGVLYRYSRIRKLIHL